MRHGALQAGQGRVGNQRSAAGNPPNSISASTRITAVFALSAETFFHSRSELVWGTNKSADCEIRKLRGAAGLVEKRSIPRYRL